MAPKRSKRRNLPMQNNTKKQRHSVYDRLKQRKEDENERDRRWKARNNNKDSDQKKRVVFEDDKVNVNHSSSETETEDEYETRQSKKKEVGSKLSVSPTSIEGAHDLLLLSVQKAKAGLSNKSSNSKKAATSTSMSRSEKIADDLLNDSSDNSSDDHSDDGYVEDFAKSLFPEAASENQASNPSKKPAGKTKPVYDFVYKSDDTGSTEDQILYFVHYENGEPVTVGAWAEAMALSIEARFAMIDTIKEAPFKAMFLETVGVDAAMAESEQFCFVLINSVCLFDRVEKYGVDCTSFGNILGKYTGENIPDAVAFKNHSEGDGILLAPLPGPGDDTDAFSHLAKFVREAPLRKVDAVFEKVGEGLVSLLAEEPNTKWWLSTNGLGISYLHFRFDTFPKHYHYKPFCEVSPLLDGSDRAGSESTSPSSTSFTASSKTPAPTGMSKKYDDDDDDDRDSVKGDDDDPFKDDSKSPEVMMVDGSIPRIDKWWTGSSDAILHGLLEGTKKRFKSDAPISTVAKNDSVVTCDDGQKYFLLRHKSDMQTKTKTKRRELLGPAMSVAQAKDDRTSQQVRMMAQRAEIAMTMQSYDSSVEADNMPGITTYVLTRDEIIEKPHLPKNGVVARAKPMWTVMVPSGHKKSDLVCNLEELIESLQKKKAADKKRKASPMKAAPLAIDKEMVDTAEDFLDNLYGDGEGKKLLAPQPTQKKRKKS